MILREGPSLSSLAESMDYEAVGRVQIADLPKILFEILENGDNTVNLEDVEGGYRQYINIRLNNQVKTFNSETKTFDVKNNYYNL